LLPRCEFILLFLVVKLENKRKYNTEEVLTAGEEPTRVVGLAVLVTDLAGGIRFTVKLLESSGENRAGGAGVLNSGSTNRPDI
jgi:hypothetical protein